MDTPTDDPLALPSMRLADPGQLLAAFLDCHRDTLLRKLDGLTDEQLAGSILPSDWSPLGLLKHLTYVERRWLRWGFLAADVQDPWGDADPDRPDGPWSVGADETYESLLADYRAETDRSRRLLADTPIARRSAVGGRFDDEAAAPALGWICCHLLQEYARHIGQLDVVRELLDGSTGE